MNSQKLNKMQEMKSFINNLIKRWNMHKFYKNKWKKKKCNNNKKKKEFKKRI